MKLRAVAIAFLLVAAPLKAQVKVTAPQNGSIHKEEMKADLIFLASDSLKGRLTGTPEARIAAEFVRARFERLGLTPAGPDNSFYQPFNLTSATLGGPNQLELSQGDSLALRLAPPQDYYPHRFSASGHVRGPVVYAGFGIRPEDYGSGVKGSIVLVLDHEPGERDPNSPFDGVVTAEASSQLRKTLLAQEKGAIGVLFVQDVHNHPGPDNFEASALAYWPKEPPVMERYSLTDLTDRVRIPAVQISPALAAILVQATNRTLLDLASAAEAPKGIAPVAIPGSQVTLTVTVDRHILSTRNVVARIDGSDPKAKDECVIICAHYDHNGMAGGQVLPGADDDVSGIVGMIDIAEAYMLAAQAGQRPRRTILFGAWDAEERGLLGAWAYVEHPIMPLEKTVAVLNLDMISRDEEVPAGGEARFRGLQPQTAQSNRNSINILGQTRFPWIKAQVEQANAPFGLDLKFVLDNNESNLLRRSDHWPFLQRGVPALWFLTGLQLDYHTVYDRPERLNYDKFEKIVRMVHQMSWNLAQQDTPQKGK
jgi:Zn-dependent M28 family amino/carboxypeptidase